MSKYEKYFYLFIYVYFLFFYSESGNGHHQSKGKFLYTVICCYIPDYIKPLKNSPVPQQQQNVLPKQANMSIYNFWSK